MDNNVFLQFLFLLACHAIYIYFHETLKRLQKIGCFQKKINMVNEFFQSNLNIEEEDTAVQAMEEKIDRAFFEASCGPFEEPFLVGVFDDSELDVICRSEQIKCRFLDYDASERKLFIVELPNLPHERVVRDFEHQFMSQADKISNGNGEVICGRSEKLLIKNESSHWKPEPDLSFLQTSGERNARKVRRLAIVEVADSQDRNNMKEKIIRIVVDSQAALLGIGIKIVSQDREFKAFTVKETVFFNFF